MDQTRNKKRNGTIKTPSTYPSKQATTVNSSFHEFGVKMKTKPNKTKPKEKKIYGKNKWEILIMWQMWRHNKVTVKRHSQ